MPSKTTKASKTETTTALTASGISPFIKPTDFNILEKRARSKKGKTNIPHAVRYEQL
jgi:hypothetical protein